MLGPLFKKATRPYICGLDLGKQQDYTALVLLERIDRSGDWEPTWWTYKVESTLRVKWIHRFPLGTPYPKITGVVHELLTRGGLFEKTELVVDATGVGAAVTDMLRQRRLGSILTPVTITAGDQVTKQNDRVSVPKKDLVAATAVMLQNRWLRVPPTLPFADTLIAEMANFRVRYTVAGNQTFEAWRERDHDDLVLAMALACWRATDLWPNFNCEFAAEPRGLPVGTILNASTQPDIVPIQCGVGYL